MRQQPDPVVLTWVDAQPVVELAISSVTVAEIRLGIALLPGGKRKRLLAQLADDMLQEFTGRQFAFDSLAAVHYADIVAQRTRSGVVMSTEDAQIAAISRVNDAVLVTRNIKDFQRIEDLRLFNPFS